jgi:hypothetical protein
MHFVKFLIATSILVLFAVPLVAGCPVHPVPGVYTTTNGTILSGRDSEAWCTIASPGVPGNTDDAMSWDGVTLGTQWHVWGMQIDAIGAMLVNQFFLPNGNGYKEYQTNYIGGQFWLSRFHAWSDGVNDLTGSLTYFNVQARVAYVAWAPVGVTSNIYFTGVFDQCSLCTLEYVITNAMLVWQTGNPGPMPANYPPFSCSATMGELYNICCVQASIFCPVAVDNKTWGAIKELYR